VIAPAFLLLGLYPELGALQATHAHAAAPARDARPPLFEDLGSYSHPITTGSAEAQRYFDQGLRLLYGFNHDEAERAFREAARLDPDAAMAYWGVALALGPNINLAIDKDRNVKALEALAKAEAALGRATDRERRYVQALKTRHSNDPLALREALDHEYATAMRDLKKRYPDDLDAATLYAEALMDLRPWKLWNKDGTPAEELQGVLKAA
jgi:tetratricopeptide (TPR) repeat protein